MNDTIVSNYLQHPRNPTGGAINGIPLNSNIVPLKALTTSSSNLPPSPPPSTVGKSQLQGSSCDHPAGTATSGGKLGVAVAVE